MQSSVAYTAVLLKYVADRTGVAIATVAAQIGEEGISRLIHNAPMNQLLPLDQIAAEMIQRHGLPRTGHHPAAPDAGFGEKAAAQAIRLASNKYEYGAGLLSVLTLIKTD